MSSESVGRTRSTPAGQRVRRSERVVSAITRRSQASRELRHSRRKNDRKKARSREQSGPVRVRVRRSRQEFSLFDRALRSCSVCGNNENALIIEGVFVLALSFVAVAAGRLRPFCTYGALNPCGPLLSIYAQRIHYRLR